MTRPNAILREALARDALREARETIRGARRALREAEVACQSAMAEVEDELADVLCDLRADALEATLTEQRAITYDDYCKEQYGRDLYPMSEEAWSAGNRPVKKKKGGVT